MLIQTRQQFTGANQKTQENEQNISNIDNTKGHFDHIKTKLEEQASDPSQNTSPTIKVPTDESTFFREERRKCSNCIESQRIIASLERQLNHEKKKIVKYSKIIHAKIDKQRQLQLAYSQIAKQMKKKIDNAMKNQPFEQVSNIIVRQNQQIGQELKRVQVQLAQKIQLIQILSDKICSQNGSSTLLKLERRRQNLCLQRQVTDVWISQKLKRSNLNIFHYPLALRSPYSKLKELDSIKSKDYQCEQQTSEQKCLNMPKNDEDSQIVQDYIFDKQDNSCNLSSYKFNDQSLIKEKDNRRSAGSQFNTVNQIQQSLSFHSVYSKSQKNIQFQQKAGQDNKKKQETRQVGSQFYSIQDAELSISGLSNVQIKNSFALENNRRSDNEWLDNIIKEKSEEVQNYRQCKQLKESKDNNKLCIEKGNLLNITQTFKDFLQDMNDKFNKTGKRNRPSHNFPNFMINVVKKSEKDIMSSKSAYQAIQTSQFQDFLSKIFAQLQNILKIQKKEYEKVLNNNRLQLSNQQTKLEEEKAQRQRLERMIEGYQFHKSLFDINQLEQQEKDYPHLVSETKILGKNSELLTSVQKKLSNIKQSKMRNQQTECSIIPADILDKYKCLEYRNFQLIDALSCIPKFLTEIHKNGLYELNFQKNLNQQIQNMLKGFIQFTFQEKQKQNADILMRARSSSVCVVPSLTFPRKSSDNLVASHHLQNENHHLKTLLKQRNEEILKLSQKLTLQNIENANCQKTIQNLRIQIYSLNDELKGKQINNSHAKLQNQYVIVGNTNHRNESPLKGSQFMDFEVKQQYNNLYWERDQQLRDLRQKVASYELQIKKCHLEHKKKKKLIYINN